MGRQGSTATALCWAVRARAGAQSVAIDASRPDRFLPDEFNFNTGGLTIDNSVNRVTYVPTYIIAGELSGARPRPAAQLLTPP